MGGTPLPDLDGVPGTPIPGLDGEIPPSQVWMGVTSVNQMGIPPISRGYPHQLDGVPPIGKDGGTRPVDQMGGTPLSRCELTNKLKTVPSLILRMWAVKMMI